MNRPERVLVVGVGGLGCPASLSLAKAGVRRLTLVDPDRVELSNLPRQLWHRTSDLNELKVVSAARKLRAAFPGIELVTRAEAVDARNVEALFAEHDWVIDGTDGVDSKFLLSDAAVLTRTRLVYGGVVRLQGQAMRIVPGGPCLRCLFEMPPTRDAVPSCAAAGVLGSVAGVIGGLQALLALGPAEPEGQSTLRVFDGVTFTSRSVIVPRAADCLACGVDARPERLRAHWQSKTPTCAN